MRRLVPTGRRVGWAVLLALPGLLLAASGTRHPMHLTYATSQDWWTLHVPGLFVFPLVGVSLMALFRGRRDPVAGIAVLLAFGYATAYSALDVVNGIAAGYVTHRLGPGVPRPDEVRYLFDIGRPFGEWGALALLLATLVVVLDALWRRRLWAVPATVMVLGAWLVREHHIFAPEGVAGMVLIGLGTGWLAWVGGDDSASGGTQSGRTPTTASRSSGP